MTNIVALIAATVLNLQTHLIPVKSNEGLTDFAMIFVIWIPFAGIVQLLFKNNKRLNFFLVLQKHDEI